MGRIYVSDAIKPALRIITDAYVKGLVSEDDIYRMAHGMAYHKEDNEKEEEKFPHTPSREEEKEKEENDDNDDDKKKSKKIAFFIPSFEMVKRYHQELNITDFTAQEFYDFYETNGWVLKEKRRIKDWMALMRGWARRVERTKKQRVNDTRKKGPVADTTAGYREDEDWRVLGEWLDANYPVSAETRAKAEEAVKRPETTLKELGRLAGTDVVYRAVIKKLYRLGEVLNTSRKGLKPEKLDRISKEILWQGDEKTLHELDIFFTKCKHGHYGNFPKGLQMTDILRALGKYLRP